MLLRTFYIVSVLLFVRLLSFSQTIEGTGGPFPIKVSSTPSDTKSNLALIIANEEFQDKRFAKLNNPLLDANVISGILKDKFGFETEVLQNITKDEFIIKLREYAKKRYNKYDQLMIYFAGHGDFDPVFRQGYVIFKDSKFADDTYSHHLSFAYLEDALSKISCPHILLTLDVCYGGTFDNYFANRGDELGRGDGLARGSEAVNSAHSLNAIIYEKLKPKTRLYLSSGGKETVSDGKKGMHSPFAAAFIQKLNEAASSEYRMLSVLELKIFLEKQTRTVKMGGFTGNESNSDFLFVAN